MRWAFFERFDGLERLRRSVGAVYLEPAESRPLGRRASVMLKACLRHDASHLSRSLQGANSDRRLPLADFE